MENPMNKWMTWGYHYFWKHPGGHQNTFKGPADGHRSGQLVPIAIQVGLRYHAGTNGNLDVLVKYPNIDFKYVPSGKLTWQWNIPMSNRKYIFKGSIFHCYVRLPECMYFFPTKSGRFGGVNDLRYIDINQTLNDYMMGINRINPQQMTHVRLLTLKYRYNMIQYTFTKTNSSPIKMDGTGRWSFPSWGPW